MRWILIDHFEEIVPGQRALGYKSVTRSEGALVDRFPCYPVMPSSLLTEMMAQVGGVLVGASIDFRKEVVLAKVADAEYPEAVFPPAKLEVSANLDELGDQAAITTCRILRDKVPVASARIFFGLFDGLGENGARSVVFSENFLRSFALKEAIRAGEAAL